MNNLIQVNALVLREKHAELRTALRLDLLRDMTPPPRGAERERERERERGDRERTEFRSMVKTGSTSELPFFR